MLSVDTARAFGGSHNLQKAARILNDIICSNRASEDNRDRFREDTIYPRAMFDTVEIADTTRTLRVQGADRILGVNNELLVCVFHISRVNCCFILSADSN